MVERVKITGSRFLTQDQSGNVTFDSNKRYIRTNGSGVAFQLTRPGFACTNPARQDGDWDFVAGNYAGFVGATLPITNPSSVGERTLPAFPVNGFWYLKGTQCSQLIYEPPQQIMSINPVRLFTPWQVYRVYPWGGETFAANLSATWGTNTDGVGDGYNPPPPQQVVWIGANHPSGSNIAYDVIVTVSAGVRLRLKPFQNLNQFGISYDDGYGNITYIPHPADGLIPGNQFACIWVSDPAFLPLEITQ